MTTGNRWVIESDGDLFDQCWTLARNLRIRGHAGTKFQVQDELVEGMTHRMITVVIPDGSTVDGKPGGKVFIIGEQALQTPDNRHETAVILAATMDDAKAK